MLARGLHHLEAASEATGRRGVGRARAPASGSGLRRLVDLEHWAAFQDSFRDVAAMAIEVAAGERGRAPGQRDVPVRRRAPQLRQRGAAVAPYGTPQPGAAEPADPGGVLADPQPALAQHALRDGGAQLRRGRSAGTPGVHGRPRCRPARSRGSTPRGRGSTTTWRSWSWHRRSLRMWWVERQGRRRRPRGAAADEGRRLHPGRLSPEGVSGVGSAGRRRRAPVRGRRRTRRSTAGRCGRRGRSRCTACRARGAFRGVDGVPHDAAPGFVAGVSIP